MDNLPLELAPPTKKLMNFKETGTSDVFFKTPSMESGLVSKRIVKNFTAQLIHKCREEDKGARAELLDELELAKNAEVLEERAPSEQPAPAPLEDLRLSAIPEEEAPRVSTSGLLSPAVQLPDQVHDEEPVPSVSPVPATSDRSESPPPAERKEKAKRKSKSSQDHSRNADDENETEEDKEKKWNRKQLMILESYRKKFKEQKEVTFTEMTKGATRKSAAQKFYALLSLKKHNAIKLQQDEPFGEIVIKKGKDLYKEL